VAKWLVEIVSFCRIIFSFAKELIAHFSAFLANCLGGGQNLRAQNGKY